MAEKQREYTPDVGSIEAPQYPGLEEYFVNPIQKLSKNPVGQFIAPTALAEYLQKLNYGDPISAGDRGLAALDSALLDKPAAVGLGALAKGIASLKGVAAAIPFWHASPNQFDRYSLANISGGTGQQAYGWGAYAARHKPTAGEYYTQFLSRDGTESTKFTHPEFGGSKYPNEMHQFATLGADPDLMRALNTWKYEALDYATTHGKYSDRGSYNAVLKSYDTEIKQLDNDMNKLKKGGRDALLDQDGRVTSFYTTPQEIADRRQNIVLQKEAVVAFRKSGGKLAPLPKPPSMYRGEYTWADPAKESATPLRRENLLNYNQPLTQQPKIMKAIKEASEKGELDESTLLGEYIAQKPRNHGSILDVQYDTGRDLYRGLKDVSGLKASAQNSRFLRPPQETAKAVSEELTRIGVPGILQPRDIRTENYVMFDDRGINLLRRDNVKLNEKAAKRSRADTLPEDYRMGGRVRMI